MKIITLLILVSSTFLSALPDCPKFVAHRGASLERPENTLVSFEQAYEEGARAIEFDCWLTKDHQVVIYHDPSLLRTAKTNDHINNLTLDQLKQLDVGSVFASEYKDTKIPTFKELLQFAQGKDIDLLIEVIDPNPQIVDAIAACLEEENVQNPFLILSSKLHILKYTAQKYPHMLCAYVIKDFEEKNIQEARDNNIQYLVLNQEVIHQALVDQLKGEGFFLFVYTVNDLETSHQFLEYGVDSIISDHADYNFEPL